VLVGVVVGVVVVVAAVEEEVEEEEKEEASAKRKGGSSGKKKGSQGKRSKRGGEGGGEASSEIIIFDGGGQVVHDAPQPTLRTERLRDVCCILNGNESTNEVPGLLTIEEKQVFLDDMESRGLIEKSDMSPGAGGGAGMEMPGGGGGGGGGEEGGSGSSGAPMADAGDLATVWTANKDHDTTSTRLPSTFTSTFPYDPDTTHYCNTETGESRWEKPQATCAHKPVHKPVGDGGVGWGGGGHVAPQRGSVVGEEGERMDAEVGHFC